jgi:predicted dehydrogenase
MKRKLNFGMIGGGKGSFIGAVHMRAAQLDGMAQLVCGAFCSSPERSKASGKDLLLPDERVYGNFYEMLEAEKQLPDGVRMDFVVIVTPNHVHFPAAMAALKAGFHVACDKPITTTLEEAKKLEKAVRSSGLLFALTHNYTGYPMVKEARTMIKAGLLGKIRRVTVEYPQGWLANKIEAAGAKQAVWRTDPKQAGASCCMGDIGSHCANLAEYVTGLNIEAVCSDLTTFVKGRKLDDDGSVLLRFENGARGVLWASQIAVGRENDLSIKVYGEKGGIEWEQISPNSLIVRWLDKPYEVKRTATDFIGNAAKSASRVPAGHVEGYQEAFANIYKNFELALLNRLEGKKVKDNEFDYPTVSDGVSGMAFLDAVVKSTKAKEKWIKLQR